MLCSINTADVIFKGGSVSVPYCTPVGRCLLHLRLRLSIKWPPVRRAVRVICTYMFQSCRPPGSHDELSDASDRWISPLSWKHSIERRTIGTRAWKVLQRSFQNKAQMSSKAVARDDGFWSLKRNCQSSATYPENMKSPTVAALELVLLYWTR